MAIRHPHTEVTLLIHIDTNRGVPYYRQVKEQITQMILSGQLKPGEQLESVANLSKRLKVNPMTVSKAYSYLVTENMLERRPGIGVFVKELPKDTQQDLATGQLSKLLSQAAALTMRMGLDHEEAQALFRAELDKIQPGEGEKP